VHIAEIGRRCAVSALVILAAGWAVAQQPKTQTATQFYLGYRAAVDKATKLEDIFPYVAAQHHKEMEETPKDMRQQLLGIVKSCTNVKVLKEEQAPGGGAVLSVEGLNFQKKQSSAKVTIVKEDGVWKVGEEVWSF
jgi:hypothetical protein